MRIMAIDYGDAHTGIAISDATCTIAGYTTVINAYMMPNMASHIVDFKEHMEEANIGADLYMMQSNAGVMTFDVATYKPVAVADSGPIAGIIAAIAGNPEVPGSLCRRAACGVWIHGTAGELLPPGGVADDLAQSAGRVIRLLEERKIIPLY